MSHIVALSGGKDSSAMALRLQELNPDQDYRFVITRTFDELPEMEAHWRKLESLLGSELININEKSLFELIDDFNMLPNFRARFCTRILKIEPFIEFMEALSKGSVMYVGLRADEPNRLGLNSVSAFDVSYPLRDWKWGLEQVKDYLARRGVQVPKRTDCGVCFFQRLGEWRDLWRNHPERYQKYVEIEGKLGHTFRSDGRDTWPADLKNLGKEFQKGRPLRRYKEKEGVSKCRFCSM